MKPTLKILKDNIFTIFVLFVFIICMFALSYVKKVYFDNNGTAAYGDRTVDVVNNKITKEERQKIVEEIKKHENVTDVEFDLEGRIITLLVTIDNEVIVSDARKIGEELLNNFTEEQLSYYAVNIYMLKTDESKNDFPITGYKHYSSKDISWTKDREATQNENE